MYGRSSLYTYTTVKRVVAEYAKFIIDIPSNSLTSISSAFVSLLSIYIEGHMFYLCYLFAYF